MILKVVKKWVRREVGKVCCEFFKGSDLDVLCLYRFYNHMIFDLKACRVGARLNDWILEEV